MASLKRACMIMCCAALAVFINGCGVTNKGSDAMNRIEEKVQKRMEKMTLTDKLDLMDGDTPLWPEKQRR